MTRERSCAALRSARGDMAAARDARVLIIATRALTACGTLFEAGVARAERHLARLGPSYPAALQAFVADLSWLRK